MYFDLLKVLAKLALATFIGDGYLYGAIGFILAQIGFDSAITVVGVLVALFIGLMQVIIATQQKGIAQQQQAVSSAQGELQAVSGWLTYLQHPDWNTRYAAVIALGQIGKEATLAPLAIALTDNTEMVRDEAATALSRVVTGEAVNEERAIQIVVGMLRNEDPAIRNAATEALTRISQRGGNRYTDNVVQAINDATPEIGAAPAREAVARILLNEHVMNKIGALASHELVAGKPDIIVAILGGGVDRSIPDINDALMIDEVNYHHDAGRPADSTTLAARLIVGSPSSRVAGVAPGVKLISERVLGDGGGGTWPTITTGFQHALSAGARVIYMEFGSPGPLGAEGEEMQQAIDEAHSAGCVILAAAGNKNSEAEHFPAAMDNVLAVAATDASDRKTPYSSYGKWVDISAPGSPMEGSESETDIYPATGTSFSGAIAAGAAALAWSVDRSLDGQTVENVLLQGADNIDALNPAFRGKLGTGRVNVLRTIETLQGSGNGDARLREIDRQTA